jgi:hypothetical protein
MVKIIILLKKLRFPEKVKGIKNDDYEDIKEDIKKLVSKNTKKYFKLCDFSNDGFLTKEEYLKSQEIHHSATDNMFSYNDQNKLTQSFNDIDTNNDGSKFIIFF